MATEGIAPEPQYRVANLTPLFRILPPFRGEYGSLLNRHLHTLTRKMSRTYAELYTILNGGTASVLITILTFAIFV